LERLLEEIHATQFEILKTRSVVLRCFAMEGKEVADELLAAAVADAEAYLEERKVIAPEAA